MKKILFGLLLLFVGLNSNVLAQGIDFKTISFNEALSQAKEQNKLIFIDFYTQWCGPCKKLAKTQFRYPEVGNFYNKHFINLSLDAEKEGLDAAKKYQVNHYPTLMFVDGDGQMIYQGSGLQLGDSLIEFGTSALGSVHDSENLESLKQEFSKRQGDEKFLKYYYQKMIDYGVSPTEGIEAWLNVQTEIREASVEMMRFLLENRRDLIVGGKSEEILNANYNTYLAAANSREKLDLKKLKDTMVRNTLAKAYKTQSPELMKAFIAGKKELVAESGRKEDLTPYTLQYLLLLKDYDAYKKQTVLYVDSLMNVQSVQQIHDHDKKFYTTFSRGKEGNTDPSVKILLESFKEGELANKQVKVIVETGHMFLQYCQTKEDFEHLNQWIDYCYQLIPGKASVDNLKANALYLQGDSAKAIELKKSALAKIPETERKRVNVQFELEQMEQGKSLMKVLVKRG